MVRLVWRAVMRPSTASSCCYPGRRCGQKWYVSSKTKRGMLCCVCVCFSFFVPGLSSIIAFVADTQLCRSVIHTNTPCSVRHVAQAAAASCAHVSCSGVRESLTLVQMQLTRKIKKSNNQKKSIFFKKTNQKNQKKPRRGVTPETAQKIELFDKKCHKKSCSN